MNLKTFLLVSASLVAMMSCSDDDSPYMTLGSKTLTVEAEGGVCSVDLAANVYYRVNNDCQLDGSDSHWAVINSTETQGENTTFTIQVSANTTTEARVGTIRFIGDKVTPLKLSITQKGVVPKGVNPVSAEVDATATEATFQVYGDKEWTATCADADVTITPASGVGDGSVKLTFPVNEALAARTIVVTVAMDGVAYTYTLTQAGYTGILADWDFNGSIAANSATFIDDADQTEFPGTNGKYVAANTGSGRIEYMAADRTGYSKGNVVCKRGIGGNGDPYISGVIPGDSWYIYCDRGGATIPAGTNIHFYWVAKMGTMTSNYWLLEYKEGDEWLPVLDMKSVVESATTTLSGASIDYSATVNYNYSADLLDTSKNGAYVPVVGTFTTGKDINELVMRFTMVGHVTLIGSKQADKYIDWTHTSGQARFSAQHPNDPETGAAIKEYTQHATIEIVE